MTHRLAPHRPAFRRRGFTLVELLVVITIISVLMALITVASLRFVASARESATRTTIKKVSEAINDRVGAVNRFHRRPVSRLRNDWRFRGWDVEWDQAGIDVFSSTADRESAQLILSRKGMLRELLPVNAEELKKAYWFWGQYDADGIPGLSAAEMAAMDAWLDDADTATPGKQRLDRPGEVMYYALLNAPVFGGERMLEEDFKPSELVDIGPADTTDPDNVEPDGFSELVDAWQQPLRVYRWPTRLVNNYSSIATLTWGSDVPRTTLMPNAPSGELDLKVDPDDRAGYISVPHPLYKVPLVAFFHDPNTWHSPLVISAGPDGVLGLEEPSFESVLIPGFPLPGLAVPRSAEEEGLFDNLTNHNASGGF